MEVKYLLKLVVHFLIVLSCLGCKEIANKAKPIKIACIGNSITYGAGVSNREQNAYPKQLQAMLGDAYFVENFGVSGNTLLKKGDDPYWESNAYQEALEFTPDVVFIKLGTNDTKQQNRVYLDTDFETDYKELIQSFKNKNKDTRIVLLLPVPSFLEDTTSIWNPIIKNKIIPLTQKVAYDTKSEVIDLYQLFIDSPSLLPDGVHPSSLGATRIARRLYEAIVQKTAKNSQGFDLSRIAEIKQFDFHGFTQTDFQYNSNPCKIVEPKRIAEGKPWVLRARFWGHEPQTDMALLERGFHIAYCDVAHFFGNGEAVDRWNNFYKLMIENGFSKKVVLEGMSRGGLIVYNWAAENPEKVACIYADAPVLDGTSWPGGKGKGIGSADDWEIFKKMYHIASEKALVDFKGNPIHKTASIAKAGFPMMHVCGEADKVVPVNENTRLFEQKIEEAGGNISTIYKADVGHHPHSLENSTPIVDFILQATKRKINFATIIAPGSEYRSAAGWEEGKGWWYQMKDIDSLIRNSGKLDLLLIGNSITQGWGGSRTLTTYKPGQQAADIYFKDLNWVSAGISGDRTEHVAWRLKNGYYDKGDPKMVTLAIGVNNFAFNTAEEIAEGIALDIKLIEEKLPKSKILFFGPLPTGTKVDSGARKKYNKIHELISHLASKKHVHYYNMLKAFSDENGDLKKDYYGGDGIHLNPGGYNAWGAFIREQYNKLIK
ncbi:GDSL-type esterase/lipase family protein [Flavivirga spongiicola]|uniref:GDSL-type esterase/lipase family protein n=1 Tax=Flavivirga spongiicola TaxID=421621 RepID=A0ABU7XPB1_9FLAO|nr:GDSL-type esterase/lipase family protein [Flavivirga sp. MEBiC05379]MDO5977371.1 GDSL-type esterase/lipase family protein [Flavivirga sp. MEBiC05379]